MLCWNQGKDGYNEAVKDKAKVASRVSGVKLCILSSCFLSPMSKNSVLEELRVRRLAVIQVEIC